MITLYHHGSSVCAAKVRIVLAEKALPWDGVYVDILRGDQFDPAYVKLNRQGGRTDARSRWQSHHRIRPSSTNIWTKCFPIRRSSPPTPSIARRCGYGPRRSTSFCIRPAPSSPSPPATGTSSAGLSPEKFAEFLDSTPPISVTADWHARKKEIVRQGMAAPRVDRTFRLYDSYLQKMEDTLARAALARRRQLLARRHRHDALCQPARHAGACRKCGSASGRA